MSETQTTPLQDPIQEQLTNPFTAQEMGKDTNAYAAVPLSMRPLSDIPIKDAGEYQAPRKTPLLYPGLRPETAYILGNNESVLPVEVQNALDPEAELPRFYINTEHGVWDLDDILKDAGATPMSDRIPVVAFGSNANPGQLVDKFAEHAKNGELRPEDSYFIPTTEGVIEGVAPAYVPKIGIWKYTFSTLYPLDGAKVETHINWLTKEQLEIMHTTEKAYEFCEHGTVTLNGSELVMPAYMYVAKNASSAYIDENRKPVVMEGASVHGADVRVVSQEGIQNELLALTAEGLAEEFAHVAREDVLTLDGLHAVINDMPNHTPRDQEKYPQDAYKKGDIGNMMVDILRGQGRVADISLIDQIPEDKQGVAPKTLAEIVS